MLKRKKSSDVAISGPGRHALRFKRRWPQKHKPWTLGPSRGSALSPPPPPPRSGPIDRTDRPDGCGDAHGSEGLASGAQAGG